MTKDTPWTALDPAKSDYRAQWGRIFNGNTLLELDGDGVSFAPKTVVIVGACSCGSRADAEAMTARWQGRADKDRFVTRATFLSWVK